MAKKVRYNGGTESYYGCSNPANLVVGQEYEVISARERAWQTDYKLKGVDGEYNSVWFDTVVSEPQVYIAVAHEPPVVDQPYSCWRIAMIDGRPKLLDCNTSNVRNITYMGNNVYEVKTRNSLYIVNVG